MHRSRTALAALVSAMVVGLAGCGPSAPAPEPGATAPAPVASTPSTDPAAAAEQRDVAEAGATLTEFVAARNAIGQAGYVDWTPLSGYVSGDLRTAMIADFADYAAMGIRETGNTLVAGTELAERTAAPDGAPGTVVALDVCLDRSQADMVDASGASVLDPERPTRYVVTYRMIREDDGRWTVNDTDPHLDRAC